RLLPTLATTTQAPWPSPYLWPQNPSPGLVSLPQALPQSAQSGLWGSGHHAALLLPGLAVAALGSVGPLCLGKPPDARQLDPPMHRSDLGPTGNYSPLRLAFQNRGQLPARHLVQFPLLYPHRLLAKTAFRMGRLSCAPSHLAAFSPRFIPKRNPQEIPGLQNQPQTLRLF